MRFYLKTGRKKRKRKDREGKEGRRQENYLLDNKNLGVERISWGIILSNTDAKMIINKA